MFIPDLPFIATHIPESLTGIVGRRSEAPVLEAEPAPTETKIDHKSVIATNDQFINSLYNSFLATIEEGKAEYELKLVESIFDFESKELGKFWNDLVEDFGPSLSDLFSMIVINDGVLQTSSGAVFHMAPMCLLDNKDDIRKIMNITMSAVYKYFYSYRNEFLNRDIQSFLSYLDTHVHASFVVSESRIKERGAGLLVPNNPLGLRGRITTYSWANKIRILYIGLPVVEDFAEAIRLGGTWSASNFVQSILSAYAKQNNMDISTIDLTTNPKDIAQYLMTKSNRPNRELIGVVAYSLVTAKLLNTIYARHHEEVFPFKHISPEHYIATLAPIELIFKYNVLSNFKDQKLIDSFVETDQNVQEASSDDVIVHTMECLDKATMNRYNIAFIIYYEKDGSREYSRKSEDSTVHTAILNLISSCVAYEYHKRELGLP